MKRGYDFLIDGVVGACCGALVAGVIYLGLCLDDAELKEGEKVPLSGFYPADEVKCDKGRVER